MAHEVFVSYGHQDKAVADAVCARLEGRGLRCWIAPRDVRPGMQYGAELAAALRDAKVLVLVFSAHANFSAHVAREVEQAVHHGLKIIPLRIEDVKPSDELGYFINSVHWLDAMTPPLERHLQQLGDSIERLLQSSGTVVSARLDAEPVTSSTSLREQLLPRTFLGALVVLSGLALGAVGSALVWDGFFRKHEPTTSANASRGLGDSAAIGRAAQVSPPPARAATKPERAPSKRRTNDRVNGVEPVAEVTPSPPPAQTASSPISDRQQGESSILGCWRYQNGYVLRMTADGRVAGAVLPGTWKLVANDRFTITWPTFTDQLSMSENGRRLTGINNFGLASRASREAPSAVDRRSLAGTWIYNNLPTIADEDGSITAGQFRGIWKNAGDGKFVIEWTHRPVDDLGLTNGGTALFGSNNYGAVISAARATCSN